MWVVRLHEVPVALRRALSAAELRRAASIDVVDRRERFLDAHAALREILSRYVADPPGRLEFALGAGGKPRLSHDGHRSLRFSLSRAGAVALVAVGTREVGVDVEPIRQRPDLVSLAERFLPEHDAAAVRAASAAQRPAAFYGAWTRLESRLKCHGRGLAARGEPAGDVAARPVRLAGAYAAAVASPGRAWWALQRELAA